MKTKIAIISGILGTLFILAMSVQAQPQNPTDANSICNQALKLPVEDGIRLITSYMANLPPAGNSSNDLMKLNFTAGYLHQLASKSSQESRQAMLNRSLRYYQKALSFDDANGSILYNMSLVNKALGDTVQSINLIDRAIRADKTNISRYSISKGDIYYDSQNFKKAANAYKTAFAEDMGNEGLGYKIFDCYMQLPDPAESFNELYAFSGELMDKEQYDLAQTGFHYALNKSLTVKNENNSIKACLMWAENLSQKTTVTPNDADELPSTKIWPSVCNSQLQMLIRNTFRDPSDLNWWTNGYERQHVTASILLKMESKALLAGDIKQAMYLLNVGLGIAPEFYVYHNNPKLENYFPVKMDIALELARLYTHYPELDANQQLFNQLIRELFNEKSTYYLNNDLESIQRSHTVLGLIYADRNIWKSSWAPANAIFQLQHAIDFQKELQLKYPEKYKPIPTLYQLLAKGYKITNRPDLEFRTLVDAAAEYLDLDNLTMTDSILHKAQALSTQDAGYTQKLKELNSIAAIRFKIRKGEYDFRNPDLNVIEGSVTNSEFFKTNNYSNDPAFVNRQKFKILADLGAKCSKLNPAYRYPLFEAKALNYLDQGKALSNYQDVNRLNLIKTRFAQNLEQPNVIRINQNVKSSGANDQTKSWALNSSGYQTNVEINNDLFVAGKVIENLAKENNNQQVEQADQIRVKKGEVLIPAELIDNKKVRKTDLDQIKGVKEVKLINRNNTK